MSIAASLSGVSRCLFTFPRGDCHGILADKLLGINGFIPVGRPTLTVVGIIPQVVVLE